jgi:hypothetical protein
MAVAAPGGWSDRSIRTVVPDSAASARHHNDRGGRALPQPSTYRPALRSMLRRSPGGRTHSRARRWGSR